ncbi:MAG: CDC/Septin GTPase family protein [Amphiamblys sp. WSBS2006]|nr:MAG: CDC/Septin GTPase family protein [Amphiamblys sp. WSBS2006]
MPIGIPRRISRKTPRFSIMAAGGAGLGKTSFLATMFPNNIHPPREIPLEDEREDEVAFSQTKTTEIYEFESGDGKTNIEIIDTAGFDEDTDIEQWIGGIVGFIEKRYQTVLDEEQRIKRNPNFEDYRVHVLLYFISPNSDGLDDADMLFFRRVGPLVNIIPIVAKADVFTPDELAVFKEQIRGGIKTHKLPIFGFGGAFDEEETEETEAEEAKKKIPFAVISGTSVREGRRGRSYTWGFADADNPEHCDTALLCHSVLVSKRQDLKDITEDYLYEQYRTENLSQREAGRV